MAKAPEQSGALCFLASQQRLASTARIASRVNHLDRTHCFALNCTRAGDLWEPNPWRK